VLDSFDDHIDGELGTIARWRLRFHLWICRQCRRYLRSYEITIRAEKAAFDKADEATGQPMSDSQIASILAAVKKAEKRDESGRRDA